MGEQTMTIDSTLISMLGLLISTVVILWDKGRKSINKEDLKEAMDDIKKSLNKVEEKLDNYDKRIQALEVEMARLKATYQI